MRAGIGFDVHRLTEGRQLVLGGVTLPHPRGLAGHSDGDVLLHAIIDALLGAGRLGDVGAMFPSAEERWAGAESTTLLRAASERVREAGRRVANVDSTVLAEEPRLAPHVEAMEARIAAAMMIDINLVSVKATTSDGLGFAGRGEGIAAFAVVLLE